MGTITRATGFPVQQASSALTIAVTPQAAGDIIIVGIAISGGTNPTITGVSGGGATGWTKGPDIFFNFIDATLWWATASTVGSSQTITITGTGLSGATLRTSVDSYHPSGFAAGSTWAQDVAGTGSSASATSVAFPSLTTTGVASELYWGVAFESNNYTAGSTAGFGYEQNPFLDGGIVHNPSLAASTTYAPTSATQGAGGVVVSAAAIFKQAPPAAAGTISRVTGFPVQVAGTGLTASITPQAVGDLLLVGIAISGGTTPTVTSVSGGGTSNWARVQDDYDSFIDTSLWWALASTVGSAQTITVAGTGLSGANLRISVDSYRASGFAAGSTWALDVAGKTANASATSVTFPSLTTTGTAPELYWGVAFASPQYTAGATAGFGYEQNPFLDGGIVHNNALAASTAYAPVSGTQGTAGHYVTAAAIFKQTVAVTPGLATVDVSIASVLVAKPLMISKAGAMAQATSIRTGVLPPVSGGTNVNRVPTGPATPSGGWQVILADGFDSSNPLSQLWGPNGDNNNGRGYTGIIPPGNTNEVAYFAASQVTIQSDGLHLSAIYDRGVGGAGKDYLSGVVITQNFISGEPGQSGFPITGFRWLPTTAAIWCFEAVITMPDFNDPGQDPGWWFSTPPWVDEFDMVEMWGYGTKPYGYGVTWIYDTRPPPDYKFVQKTIYGDPIQTDGRAHRWTHVFNGPTQTVEVYIDGTHRTDLSFAWPPTFNSALFYMIISHAMRNVYGTPPTFTTGSKEMIIRSVAAYASGTGLNYTGGLIAPGTTLV